MVITRNAAGNRDLFPGRTCNTYLPVAAIVTGRPYRDFPGRLSMVTPPTITAAGCQHRAWPQRAEHSKLNLACKFYPKSRPGGVGTAPVRQVCRPRQCSAATHNSVSSSSCSSNEIQLVKGLGSSRACKRLPGSLAEVLVTASCRLVEITASLSLITQVFPAQAGEIIQGVPRVSDGDTLQVQPCSALPQAAKQLQGTCANRQVTFLTCRSTIRRSDCMGLMLQRKPKCAKMPKVQSIHAVREAIKRLLDSILSWGSSCNLHLKFAGLQSGEALHSMIGSNAVRCEVRNKDQYGRNVSSCSVLTNKGPMDIGNFMVSNGYAVAYRLLHSRPHNHIIHSFANMHCFCQILLKTHRFVYTAVAFW